MVFARFVEIRHQNEAFLWTMTIQTEEFEDFYAQDAMQV